jgi:hypothetical protein
MADLIGAAFPFRNAAPSAIVLPVCDTKSDVRSSPIRGFSYEQSFASPLAGITDRGVA